MSDGQCFFMGFFLAAIIAIVINVLCIVRPHTEISQEILRNIQQSTNIVEALKKENLVIRSANTGKDADTVELVVEYEFLYKNSKRK